MRTPPSQLANCHKAKRRYRSEGAANCSRSTPPPRRRLTPSPKGTEKARNPMTTLQYKGFHGSVEFEDSRLVIQILHIDDIIATEIDSASAAQTAFEELVDDYLAARQPPPATPSATKTIAAYRPVPTPVADRRPLRPTSHERPRARSTLSALGARRCLPRGALHGPPGDADRPAAARHHRRNPRRLQRPTRLLHPCPQAYYPSSTRCARL